MWESIAAVIQVIGGIITGVVGPFVVWWLKEVYYGNKTNGPVKTDKRNVNEEVEFAEDINEELEDIKNEVECDRAWIAQFHNGGKVLNSVRENSMKRISVIYESTAPGVSKEQNTFSGMLVSFFSGAISYLIQNDHSHHVKSSNDLKPEIELLFRQRGTEEMHLFSMKNIDEVLVGFMGIEYLNEDRGLSEQEIRYLTLKANLLAGYISYGVAIKNKQSNE